MTIKGKIYHCITHYLGMIMRRYYFEDFVRVYPNGIVYDKLGRKGKPDKNSINNFLNHLKFYNFASQFCKNKHVVDIGCGSGYGCEVLTKSGAASVNGSDLSKSAIKFAKAQYGDFAKFLVSGITNLNKYEDNSFDITIANEVLEHIKEYGKVDCAIKELVRITKPKGLIIIGTPNSELLSDHGFYFNEINTLIQKYFTKFIIFENALIPFGIKENIWKKRLLDGQTGIIISERIN
ncbi:MAG: class I SAM-dependent methyltransferase [Bacteroidetes bacterium]|nr:class I SAM-dependent methyltransferase [Bacteroidota bacterium]